MENNNLYDLIQGTVKEFIDPNAEVLIIDSNPINMGLQAVDLRRYKVLLGNKAEISLITKSATSIERRVLNRLYKQKANVPYSLSYGSEVEERAPVCIQDVDYQTDYGNLNINLLQKKEMKALAHIHASNFGLRKELSWLPLADCAHIEKMINERWKPQWEVAKNDDQFINVFGDYITAVESTASTIIGDLQNLVNDEANYTLIHNDLNPGNVLVHNSTDVFFIDWEEARYGSLFLDIPLRCGSTEQVEEYRESLSAKGVEFSDSRFTQFFNVASRYVGLKYMGWNLGNWTNNSHAREGLQKYLGMVVGTSLR
jgi:hypothetical protein